MSTAPPGSPRARGDSPVPAGPVEPPPSEEPVAEPDRIAPAIMIGIFVVLLLCVALALIAYQHG